MPAAQLCNLIVLYDNNISIEDNTDISEAEDEVTQIHADAG